MGFSLSLPRVTHLILYSWPIGSTGPMALPNWKWLGSVEQDKNHLVLLEQSITDFATETDVCVDWTLMETKSHYDLRQLEGPRLSHGCFILSLVTQFSHGGGDIHFPEIACPPTICESRQNSPKYWHWENLEPMF